MADDVPVQHPNSIPVRRKSSISVRRVVRSVPLPRLRQRLVPLVFRRRRSVKTSPRRQVTGYENITQGKVGDCADIAAVERSPRHSPPHHQEQAGCRLRRSIRFFASHQGAEGATTRPQEGEEHQAHQVHPT